MKIKKSGSNQDHTTQQYEESTLQALDAVCASDTQTYDQFMANFTHLAPADVVRASLNIGSATEEDDWQPQHLPPLANPCIAMATNTQPIAAIPKLAAGSGINNSQDSTKAPAKHSPETLDEEILAEGTVTEPYIMRPKANAESLKVRLGNFVEGEIDSDSEGDGYLPSFSTTGEEAVTKQAKLQPEVSVPKSTVPLTAKGPKHLASSQTKFSTLLDELAAIQSGKTTGNIPKHAISKGNDRNTSEQLLDFPKKESCEIAAQIMAHASVKNHCSNDQSDSSEENILDLIRQSDDQSEDEDQDNGYDSTLDIPNPGEVVEEKDTIVKDFVTKLNFTAHVRDNRNMATVPSSCDQKGDNFSAVNDEVTDEVQTFSLDENFDYDNVVLSPKYNEAEMAIIMNAMKATAQEQAASS